MKVFNIYPVANQDMYSHDEYAMILAHVLKAGKYNSCNFWFSKYIIMDNGAYEGSQVSQDIHDLIKLAVKAYPGIKVNEIVIPDVLGNYEETKKLFFENYGRMFLYRYEFRFMYVAQAQNEKQLKEAVKMVNKEKELKLCLGIPKHSALNRTSKKVIRILSKCKVPIHFLGVRESFAEMYAVNDLIRSCDSAQIAYIARDYHTLSNKLYLMPRTGEAIDLLTDNIDAQDLKLTHDAVMEELRDNGIL